MQFQRLVFFYSLLYAAAVFLSHTVSFWFGNRWTTVAVLEGVLLVTTTNGASAYACVRMWACQPEHNAMDNSNPRFL